MALGTSLRTSLPGPCLPRRSEQVCQRTCESLSSERLRARGDNSKCCRASRAEELAKAPLKIPATLVLSPGRDTSLQATPNDSNARQPAWFYFHTASISTRRASDRARLQLSLHSELACPPSNPIDKHAASCSFAASTHSHPYTWLLSAATGVAFTIVFASPKSCSSKIPEATSC